MSQLKREAMGQYNYVAATPAVEKNFRTKPKHSYPDFYPHTDVTVEIIEPNGLQNLFKMKPPTMFESSYHTDYRHPPSANFGGQKHNKDKEEHYTAYTQAGNVKRQSDHKTTAPKSKKDANGVPNVKISRNAVKSAGQTEKRVREIEFNPLKVARAQSVEPKIAAPFAKDEEINTEFYRALLKARAGSEWKRPPDISYDVMNPPKPNQERSTNPYGAHMEQGQEKIASDVIKTKGSRPANVRSQPVSVNGSISSDMSEVEPVIKLLSKPVTPQKVLSPSRTSTASQGRAGSSLSSQYVVTRVNPKRPSTSCSSMSSMGGDYFLETGHHLSEVLETIQEEEIQEQLFPKSQQAVRQPAAGSLPKQRRRKLRKPAPPVDLFKRKGPDSRFYASKKNLRTPNEMERFRKARNRTYMRNVEQAVPELDFTDHQVKYQPERQLFQDARWKIRKDVKDVRNKNLHSLVDRFAKRHVVVNEEIKTRLGDPTYIGRDPVSIYTLQDIKLPDQQHPPLGLRVAYPLHNRRRITPSLGSVQRARNLGSHAQIFNQACAPPTWGPQKVDHGIFMPAVAQKI